MEYPVKKRPLNVLAVGSRGVVEPLCNFCKTKDCTNPIENRKVSIFGINRIYRVFRTSGDDYQVYDCKGFIPPSDPVADKK